VTACTWNFGDGVGTSTSTATAVSYAYANPGPYTVTLTATDGNGTQTLTRNNYVNVYVLPAPSYVYGKVFNTNNTTTVNFTNTSANSEYAKWALYDSSGSYASSHRLLGASGQTVSYTYTNTVTANFGVILSAGSPAGSVNYTNTISVP
jgi:PKD repeat protein